MAPVAPPRGGKPHDLAVQALSPRAYRPAREHDGRLETSHRVLYEPAHGLVSQARPLGGDEGVVDAAHREGLEHPRVLLARALRRVHHVVPALERGEGGAAREGLGLHEVALPVVVDALVGVGDALRAAERLHEEGVVRPARPGHLNKADALLLEVGAPVEGRPDRGVVQQQLNAVAHGKRLAARADAPAVRAAHADGLRARGRAGEDAPVGPLRHVHAPRPATTLRTGEKRLDAVWLERVVRLDDGDPGAARHVQASVAGRPVALVGLVHDDVARVGGGVGAHDLGRAVGRPVVDAHDLKLPVGLRLDAREALVERGLRVVDGYDD